MKNINKSIRFLTAILLDFVKLYGLQIFWTITWRPFKKQRREPYYFWAYAFRLSFDATFDQV